jgi:hypothetical protein
MVEMRMATRMLLPQPLIFYIIEIEILIERSTSNSMQIGVEYREDALSHQKVGTTPTPTAVGADLLKVICS